MKKVAREIATNNSTESAEGLAPMGELIQSVTADQTDLYNGTILQGGAAIPGTWVIQVQCHDQVDATVQATWNGTVGQLKAVLPNGLANGTWNYNAKATTITVPNVPKGQVPLIQLDVTGADTFVLITTFPGASL
jgi:hypothetical protein